MHQLRLKGPTRDYADSLRKRAIPIRICFGSPARLRTMVVINARVGSNVGETGTALSIHS